VRWSKLKSLIEAGIADSLRGRVSINSTAYGCCSCGHAWITLDKEVIANFCTRAHWNRKYYDYESRKYVDLALSETEKNRYRNQFVEYGDFSRQDLYRSCWRYIHDLTIEAALESDDVLVQSLAILDKRLGQRRLMRINPEKLHPLVRVLFIERKTSLVDRVAVQKSKGSGSLILS
jgi:hypothetical protein